MKIWDLILIPIPKNGTQIPIFLDPDPKEQFIACITCIKVLLLTILKAQKFRGEVPKRQKKFNWLFCTELPFAGRYIRGHKSKQD